MHEYKGFKDLKVYQLSYAFAMDIFKETKNFPTDEKYTLTDQMRRCSRSVAAQLAEAWKKRRYEKAFVSKLVDCSSEAAETQVWLDMSLDCGYLTIENHRRLSDKTEEVSKMLYSMIIHPEKFCY